MITILTVLSALVAVVLLVALAYLATRIAHTLEAIGSNEPSSSGRSGARVSHLARIWFGVNAIEKQVSALPVQATRLNDNLEKLASGLATVRNSLQAAYGAVERQTEKRRD